MGVVWVMPSLDPPRAPTPVNHSVTSDSNTNPLTINHSKMDHELPIDAEPKPPLFNYVISFLLVGVAWGFTTPFIRRAAADFNARQESRRRNQEHSQQSQISAQGNQGKGKGKDERTGSVGRADREDDNRDNTTSRSTPDHRIPISWAKDKITTLLWTVVNLLRTPAYSIPLVINLTGSIWFFLLVGKHGIYPPCCQYIGTFGGWINSN